MRKNGRILTCFLWVVSLAWMGLCLYLSWQPGEETAALSKEIALAVQRVLRLFGAEVDINILHAFLRKNAHGAIFFVSGVLLFCLLKRSLPRGAHADGLSFWLAAAVSAASAVVAEAGKRWIPGRHLQWDETLLDVIGAVCGVSLAWAAGKLFSRRR